MPVSELIVMVRTRSDVELLAEAARGLYNETYNEYPESIEKIRQLSDLIEYLEDRIAKYDDAAQRGELTSKDDEIPF